MPEHPPSGVPEDPAGRRPAALTPEAVESVLADFRSWLQLLAEEPPGEAGDGPEEGLDLHTLLGQLVALRHEVNLQTKAARAQQEQNAETLRQLGETLEVLRANRDAARPPEEEAEALRPLLKTLVDVYDALALAGREVQKVEATLRPALEQLTSAFDPPPATVRDEHEAPRRRGFWSRWLSGPDDRRPPTTPAERPRQAGQAADRVRQVLGSVLTGYDMSLQRVERALRQHGLEPIACLDGTFDPEQMEVVAVVADSGRPAGEVVAEVRRGYLWRGRVFRYAQVSVAKQG
jgi:molecular chaperone GrpE